MPASIDDSGVDQQPLTEEEAFQLGVSAYIYAYPLLVMDSAARSNDECGHTSGHALTYRPIRTSPVLPRRGGSDDCRCQPDTLYSIAWLDLSRGPYVLHVPDVENRFYMMPILDGWTEVIGNPGTRTTGGKAGDTP